MIFPRLTLSSESNIFKWASQLVNALERNRNEILASFIRQDDGGTIRINGRIQVNQNLTDPDVSTSDRVGEIRYNTATSKFQGFDGSLWRDFH